MNRLFHSATVRLTAWYVMILTIICLMFSIIVYQITMNEMRHRLNSYDARAKELRTASPFVQMLTEIHAKELTQARANLVIILFYTNLIVIFSGGVGAYFLAKRTLRPIEDAHEQQVRFVSDASHELRTPLATMTTELEVALRDTGLKKEEMKELLKSNLEEVRRLTKLSNVLLVLSTGNTASLQGAPFDLAASISSVVHRLDTDTSPLVVEVPPQPLIVTGHQPSIEELVTILVDNAIKYSPTGGAVSIQVAARQQRAVVTVTNTGPGIAAKHLPRIFDRFYRADTSRSGNNGHGLGLALAKQISDLHQAELSVKSTPHKTTRFSFTLPRKK